VSSLPKTVTRQRRGCDLNPGPSAPESSTLTTRLPSHSTLTLMTWAVNPRRAVIMTHTQETNEYLKSANLKATATTNVGPTEGIKNKEKNRKK